MGSALSSTTKLYILSSQRRALVRELGWVGNSSSNLQIFLTVVFVHRKRQVGFVLNSRNTLTQRQMKLNGLLANKTKFCLAKWFSIWKSMELSISKRFRSCLSGTHSGVDLKPIFLWKSLIKLLLSMPITLKLGSILAVCLTLHRRKTLNSSIKNTRLLEGRR
jgi:hypothetical protein